MSKNQQAYFVTIEGGDGSGKSTLLASIESDFKRHGLPYITTREPGGTPVAEEVREILLKPGRKMSAMAELLLYEAGRADHVEQMIRPALAQGRHVLCDRFTHSSLAYQGGARGLGLKLVEQLNDMATGGLKPDVTLWLRLAPEAAAKRAAQRGELNRLDQEKAVFHEAVFKAFEDLSKRDASLIVLDASQPPVAVFQQLLDHPRWRSLFGAQK